MCVHRYSVDLWMQGGFDAKAPQQFEQPAVLRSAGARADPGGRPRQFAPQSRWGGGPVGDSSTGASRQWLVRARLGGSAPRSDRLRPVRRTGQDPDDGGGHRRSRAVRAAVRARTAVPAEQLGRCRGVAHRRSAGAVGDHQQLAVPRQAPCRPRPSRPQLLAATSTKGGGA